MLLCFPLHFHCWVFADIEKTDAFAGRKDWCFCRDRKRLLLLLVFFFFSKTPPKKTLTPKIEKPWKQNPKPLPAPTKQWKHPTHTLIVRASRFLSYFQASYYCSSRVPQFFSTFLVVGGFRRLLFCLLEEGKEEKRWTCNTNSPLLWSHFGFAFCAQNMNLEMIWEVGYGVCVFSCCTLSATDESSM